jgi:hypothetical protein
MPVVIGDFEVVAPPPAPAAAKADDAGAASAPPAAPDPQALARVLAELHEAALRTWSH